MSFMKLLKLKTLLKKSKGEGVTKKEIKNPSEKNESEYISNNGILPEWQKLLKSTRTIL